MGMLLTIHSKTLISLFLDWDEDGNGGIGKKEFRRALAGLQYDVPKAIINALFDKLDTDHDDWLTYAELKKGVSKFIGQRRTDHGQKRPTTSDGMRPSVSRGSLGSLGSTSSMGSLERFSYGWAQDHAARWPYESYPSKRAMQMSLITAPRPNTPNLSMRKPLG